MPEWPDLAVLRRRLDQALTGRTVSAVWVHNPVVIRAALPLHETLMGRCAAGVDHRGKFLALNWDNGGCLVVNPMLTGVFALSPAWARRTRDTALVLQFAGGDPELRYRDEKQMGKVYAVPPGAAVGAMVPGWDGLGPPADLSTLDSAGFARRARRRRYEVRNLLLDQEFLAGIGNAYADEILWAARLHPKRKVTSLSDDELANLYAAIGDTVAAAAAAVEHGLPPQLGAKVRSHMQVRGREGKSCSRCGATILLRSLGYLETNFCPRCQPAPEGQIY